MKRLDTNLAIARCMRGLTLIETMVAITISIILLGGAITLFINNKVAYESNDNLSRLQENARFAIDFMVDDLRMAGYFGCRNGVETVTNTLVTTAGDGTLEDTLNPLEGFDDASINWSPSGNADTVANILDGTDAITIRHLGGGNQVVTARATGELTIEDGTAFSTDGLMAVSDCGGTDVFQATDVTGNVVSHGALAREYDSNGDTDDLSNPMVSSFVAVRYFVGTDANGNPALLREVLDTALAPQQQVLIEGVESMHIVYGVDTDNDNVPDTYLPAGDGGLDEQTEWANVIAVRVSLLVRTTRPYGTGEDTINTVFRMNDDVFTVPDDVINVPDDTTALRFKRRLFNTTVLLRNRLT